MSRTWRCATVVLFGWATGCGEHEEACDASAPAPPPSPPLRAAPAASHAERPELAPCPDPALHHEQGVVRGWVCPDAAARRGLTIVDLSERWAPRPFGPTTGGLAPRFRETYLALAAGQDPDGGELPAEERLVEMYGIAPAPSVILARLRDDARHACHRMIDDTPLRQVRGTLKQAPNPQIDAGHRRRRYLAAMLAREQARRRLPDLAAVGALPRFRAAFARWRRLETEHAAVRAAQQHLLCEGLLERRFLDGRLIWLTARKLDLYQRDNFLLPHGELDADTREALVAGALELDFRAALRLLRERVVDATGLIEDGSAGPGAHPVLGRQLEPAVMRQARGHKPLAHAAPDLIGIATEQAAQHLGWTEPVKARDFLARWQGATLRVAIALPPAPAYHSSHMQLRAVLDRGDVWYDPSPRWRPIQRRPALILYARDAGRDLALVRWPTTIGGWADEVIAGGWVVRKWKESDVGRRMWKELYVAPTWQPPDTTPDLDLMRNLWNGRWRLKREVFGPGPRSAYGMVMLIHHKPVKMGRDRVYWGDRGIRVHGSSSVTSVVRGTSHGCHRLLNHLAVRLGAFLLRHRDHVVHGDRVDRYRREVRHLGQTYQVKLDTRGFLYELTPPVEIQVTRGRVRSARKRPHAW